MIRLVVNADDLGLHPRIDAGILRAHREGIVTSATVLVTGRSAQAAVHAAKEQGLALGVHLCLSTHLSPAAPPSQVRWLAPGGRFRAHWAEVAAAWAVGLIPPEEVARELRAQLARARELGFSPDHLDAHQHLHLLPGLSGIVQRLAQEESLPLRWPLERPRPSWLLRPAALAKSALLSTLAVASGRNPTRKVRGWGVFASGVLDEARLLSVLRALPEGDHELVCHPGLNAGVVPEDPRWSYRWESELAALTSNVAQAAVRQRGIELTTYSALHPSPG
ncbi:MAG: carbohydrate deacetylase [Myxococcota bacterium]